MNTLDITIDLETLSLSPDAAIVQVAAVPWNRHTHTSDAGGPFDYNDPFNAHVSVNSCIRDGFRIDEDTLKWWKEKDKKTRESVFNGECHELPDVLLSLRDYIEDTKKLAYADTVNIWAQGTDFDIAVLRFAFHFYDIDFPVPHACFRDARTILNEYAGEVVIPECALQLGCKHDAFTDATLTTWRVWHALLKYSLSKHDLRLTYRRIGISARRDARHRWQRAED